ncbi:MAG: hypothetical protein EOP06_07625 [Proteobacteria bacterium]|nr:MAG: hypothetical protein EOP06_07625 [Pseudomonadota bacterium]
MLRVCFFAFGQNYRILSRLLSDEKKLVKFNDELPKTSQQKPHPVRKKHIYISMAGLAVSIFSGYLLLSGTFTRGGAGGHVRAIEKSFHKFVVRQEIKTPNSSDLFNIWVLYLFLASNLVGHVQFQILFRRGKYLTLFKALTDNALNQGPGTQTYWYYPERVLFLDLVGKTGEDLVKSTALWRQANFMPAPEVVNLSGSNQYLLPAAPVKKTESTMIWDHYEEWTETIANDETIDHYFLGECLFRDELLWKPAFDDFSILFLGQTGSGKTESMKCWLTNFLCKHPYTHLVICDQKKTGDWQSYAPLADPGYIIKSNEEAMYAIAYFDTLLEQREIHMRDHNYKNIRQWSEEEKIDVPPVLLIIDEFPQLSGMLKYESFSKTDLTPANTLFKLYTKGRSFGLWVILGTQMSSFDAVPPDINKNIKVKAIHRVGTSSESIAWLKSDCASDIGKGTRKKDGSPDKQLGHAYVENERDFVRFGSKLLRARLCDHRCNASP